MTSTTQQNQPSPPALPLFPQLRGLTKALVLFGGWTVLGLFQAARLVFAYNFSGSILISTGQAIVWALGDWYLWGLLSLVIIRLAVRFRFSRDGWPVSLGVHAAGAVMISAVQLTAYSAFWQLTEGLFYHQIASSVTSFGNLVLSMFAGKGHAAVFTYFLIVFVTHAILYYRRLRDEEVRRVDLESRLSRAELEALRSQLHPHFLFNTLNSIATLIHSDPELADRMIARLSELLRASLRQGGAQEVTLKSEMDLLQRYLDIQSIRFQDRLETTIDVNPDALDVCVPNLILQPLVENVMQHVVARREERAALAIHASISNGQLHLVVDDDGPGLPDDFDLTRCRGVGLTNTRSRLLRLYGNAQDFDLKTSPRGGLRVELRIPVRTDCAEVTAS